eukprot:tig00020710_g13373.t1
MAGRERRNAVTMSPGAQTVFQVEGEVLRSKLTDASDYPRAVLAKADMLPVGSLSLAQKDALTEAARGVILRQNLVKTGLSDDDLNDIPNGTPYLYKFIPAMLLDAETNLVGADGADAYLAYSAGGDLFFADDTAAPAADGEEGPLADGAEAEGDAGALYDLAALADRDAAML